MSESAFIGNNKTDTIRQLAFDLNGLVQCKRQHHIGDLRQAILQEELFGSKLNPTRLYLCQIQNILDQLQQTKAGPGFSGSSLNSKKHEIKSAPTGNRTPNLLIKSQLLCQLSYGRVKIASTDIRTLKRKITG